jgi:hypothetical protein
MDPVPGHKILTERQLNLCEYGGAFGVMLSLTCLIQHFIVTINNWITQSMIPCYLFAIVAFLLLAIKKPVAPFFLIISGVLSLFAQFLWTKHQSISVVVLCLFLYHVIIIVGIYAEHVPSKLKQKKDAEKAERETWAGKI